MAQGHRANKRQVPTQAGGARIGFSPTTSVGGFFFFFQISCRSAHDSSWEREERNSLLSAHVLLDILLFHS